MDWQLINSIYDALCKVMSQARLNSMIEVLFVVVWATVILLLISIAVGFGGLFISLENLIPSRGKQMIDSKGGRISLWQTLKKVWTKKEDKQAIVK
jgi:hypothetical protein